MPSYSKVITEVTTEMPRSRSIFIQSERVLRRSPLALTWPARLIAPPNSRSFSVSVVLPASGCEMMAKVRRRATSAASGERSSAALCSRGLCMVRHELLGPFRHAKVSLDALGVSDADLNVGLFAEPGIPIDGISLLKNTPYGVEGR